MMKRFMATLVALIMSFVAVTPAFASETGEIDYLNYQFPDDAVVIYQSEDGVVYQSKESPASVTGTSSMEYNGVWLNAGNNSMGSFSITNPHPSLFTTTQGTFKIESNYSSASAEMVLYASTSALTDKTLSASDGDVHFSFKSLHSGLTVRYYPHSVSNTYGMRLMCWLW